MGSTRKPDAIIRAVVVPPVAEEEARDRADDAHPGRVILIRAHLPHVRVIDVDLPARVMISEQPPGQDRYRVVLVVDVRDVARQLRVDEVRPVLVADARQAV